MINIRKCFNVNMENLTKSKYLYDFIELVTILCTQGQMASMFYNKVGAKLFYASLIIYLYGDLAIYAAAMPKSLRNVIW